MSIPIGINGFGTIGQTVFLAALADPSITVKTISDASVSAAYVSHVIEREYAQRNPTGPLMRVTEIQKDQIILNGTHAIRISTAQDPQCSLWRQYGAQYVLECTGLYTTRSRNWGHATGGAVGIFIAGLSVDTETVLMFMAEEKFSAALPICAAGSPIGAAVATILEAATKVVEAEQVTYTAVCGPQPPRPIGPKSEDPRDWRQARVQSCASSVIAPCRDNGVETVCAALPHLAGSVNGNAFQVPVARGCAIDLVLHTKEATTAEIIAGTFLPGDAESDPCVVRCAANCPMFSVDCVGNPHIFFDSASSSSSVDGKVHRLVFWVDLERYYSAVLLSLVKRAYNLHSPPPT